MATFPRQQPRWQPPPQPGTNAQLPPLKIWNSLTRSKMTFVPLDWKHKTVTWYACGPTVYDDAHLGHARNYVSTDIIRRILRDYFGFKVKFVMNITDVDDKIIVRARQQYLLVKHLPETYRSATQLSALAQYLAGTLPLIPSSTPPVDVDSELRNHYADVFNEGGRTVGDREAKIKMHIKTASIAAKAMLYRDAGSISDEDYLKDIQDIMLPYFDSLHRESIDSKDHSIFTKLTKRYEDRFMEDVRALNVLDPDEITRVTEYGNNIVEFVKKIESNGFAYSTSDGSVYFDTTAFEEAGNSYARLEPWNRNNTELQADGEGALSKKIGNSDKRSSADFALWKASKAGEPSWPSPWGDGRPGWHIECSAMASDKLGRQIDIHSGGIDLAFPHHDNELAQSEAYWSDCSHNHQHQWVNYFMHMGHLSIQGSKMSKSLKNFTTIREALGRGDWTPRGLRIVFLLGGWRDGIEITDDLVKQGSAWEDKLNNFFLKVRDISGNSTQNGHDGAKNDLGQALTKAQNDTQEALCDSFYTPSVMQAISDLVSHSNAVERGSASSTEIIEVAQWVTKMVNILGLNGAAAPEAQPIGWSGIDIPESAKEHLYPLSSIRDQLRSKARAGDKLSSQVVREIFGSLDHVDLDQSQLNSTTDNNSPYANVAYKFANDIVRLKDSPSFSSEVLQLCDRLRDMDLWNLNIYLEDRDSDQPALVRPVTKELRALREEKDERDRFRLKAKAERDKETAAKAERGRMSHTDMFRTDEYSEWDQEGFPLKDKEGEELTKSKQKKLKKEWDRQMKLHEAWQKANSE